MKRAGRANIGGKAGEQREQPVEARLPSRRSPVSIPAPRSTIKIRALQIEMEGDARTIGDALAALFARVAARNGGGSA